MLEQVSKMSEKLKGVVYSKWTAAILLGVGTVAVAGGAILVVYAVRRWRSRSVSLSEVTVTENQELEPMLPLVGDVSEPMLPLVGDVSEPALPLVVNEVAMLSDDVLSPNGSKVQSVPSFFLCIGEDQADGIPASYDDVYNYIKVSLQPLSINKDLHSVFLKYTSPPHTTENLMALMSYLEQYEEALSAVQPTPASMSTTVIDLLNQLSSDSADAIVEIKSLVCLSEALMEFPQHIVKRAIALPKDKRQTLVDLIRNIPCGVDKYVCNDEGPYNDQDLYPIMTRLGFSIPRYQNKLVYGAPNNKKIDILAMGIYLLLGTDSV